MPSGRLLQPDEVARVDAGDLADGPADVASELQDAAGRSTRWPACGAGPVTLHRAVGRLVGRGGLPGSLGLGRRRRVVVMGTSACLRRTDGVDLVELDVVLGPPVRVADAIERGIDLHHAFGRRLARDVRVDTGARAGDTRPAIDVVIPARLDAEDGVCVVGSR